MSLLVDENVLERTRRIQEANKTDEVDDYNFVGKYDCLVVWQRKDGRRWSVHLNKWVTQKSNEYTSWLDEEDRPELAEWVESGGKLPEGGKWVDINEC